MSKKVTNVILSLSSSAIGNHEMYEYYNNLYQKMLKENNGCKNIIKNV